MARELHGATWSRSPQCRDDAGKTADASGGARSVNSNNLSTSSLTSPSQIRHPVLFNSKGA